MRTVCDSYVISTHGAASYIASTTVTEKISENWGGNSIESEKKSPCFILMSYWSVVGTQKP